MSYLDGISLTIPSIWMTKLKKNQNYKNIENKVTIKIIGGSLQWSPESHEIDLAAIL